MGRPRGEHQRKRRRRRAAWESADKSIGSADDFSNYAFPDGRYAGSEIVHMNQMYFKPPDLGPYLPLELSRVVLEYLPTRRVDRPLSRWIARRFFSSRDRPVTICNMKRDFVDDQRDLILESHPHDYVDELMFWYGQLDPKPDLWFPSSDQTYREFNLIFTISRDHGGGVGGCWYHGSDSNIIIYTAPTLRMLVTFMRLLAVQYSVVEADFDRLAQSILRLPY